MEAGGSQQPQSSGQTEGNVTTRTGIRPPGTIIKPPQPSRLNAYGNYVAPNKFRIINPNTGSNTLIRPLQRLQLQHQQPNPSNQLLSAAVTSASDVATHQVQQSQEQQLPPKVNPTRLSQANTKTITRIPAKPSGLVRPTPIKQLATSVSQQGSLNNLVSYGLGQSTSGQSSRLPSSLSASNSRLASLRPPSTGPTSIKSTGNGCLGNVRTTRETNAISTTLDKPKALPRARVSPNRSLHIRLPPESETRSRTTTTTTSVITSSSSQLSSCGSSAGGNGSQHVTNIIDLSSVENDVGQIRRLLEQLLVLLQESRKDQQDMETENETLKREVADLKGKIRAIRSTVAAGRDSGYSLRMQTPVHVRQQQFHHQKESNQPHHQQQYHSDHDGGDDASDPPTDGDRRDGFLTEMLSDAPADSTTINVASREQYGQTEPSPNINNNNNNNNNNQRGPSSVYLSPYI